MKAWGRVFGALLGVPAGIPGVAFGFLVGYLIDRALENRGKMVRFSRFLGRPEDVELARSTGILYATAGLLTHLGTAVTLRSEYFDLLPAAGAKTVAHEELSGLVATARGEAVSYRGLLMWVGRHVTMVEAKALATILLLPPTPEGGTTVSQVRVAREVVAPFALSGDDRREMWRVAKPIAGDAAAILGVERDADETELHRAFRLLAAQFHPDSLAVLDESQRDEAAEAFVRIRGAYDSAYPVARRWFE